MRKDGKDSVARTNPLMMRLMQALIYPRNVQPTMDPVDAEVREEEKPNSNEYERTPQISKTYQAIEKNK